MHVKTRKQGLGLAPARAGFVLIGALPLLVALQAQAVEFSFAEGEVAGSLDTTVSYGQLWRVQGRDKTNDDINTNDGNRNFNTGLVSEVYKITSDLEATYQNYGVFVRGTAFYDTQIMDKRNDYYSNNNPAQPSQNFPRDNSFTYDTRHSAGRSAEILDAYVYGNWDVAGMPLTAKVGKQVFNWGEGLFYRGGVNTTNPIDAGKFRLPGSELKEVLVPVEALNFSLGLTDNLSMEAFYQWNWKESAIDPVGTYFSETDLFAEGGNTAYSTQAKLLPVAPLYAGLSAAGVGGLQGGRNIDANGNIKVASVGPDLNAKNDGQYGFAFRYVAEELNNTEFGAYFVNYHAKEPTISANLGDYKGLNLQQIAQGACAASGLGAACANPAVVGNFMQAAGGMATIDVANAVQAQREYAEDIRMYGLSFNTTLGNASVFGELAYRPNLPIGVATTNDLLGDLLTQAPQLASGRTVNIGGQNVHLGDSIHNYQRVEAYNTSLGTIYNFGPTLSFDSLMGVAELASEHIRGNDLKYTDYKGNVRKYAGRPNNSYVSGFTDSSQIDKDAYGYTLAVSGTWNDVFAGVNLSPFAVYKNDFQGNSHQTGNFYRRSPSLHLGSARQLPEQLGS